MQQVVNALDEETFAKGECIVRQGEVGHTFYILQKGEISVFKKEEETSVDGEEKSALGAENVLGTQVGILR